jgi:hypothetical protein
LFSSDGCCYKPGRFIDGQEDFVVGLGPDLGELGEVDSEVVFVGHSDGDVIHLRNTFESINLETERK